MTFVPAVIAVTSVTSVLSVTTVPAGTAETAVNPGTSWTAGARSRLSAVEVGMDGSVCTLDKVWK